MMQCEHQWGQGRRWKMAVVWRCADCGVIVGIYGCTIKRDTSGRWV